MYTEPPSFNKGDKVVIKATGEHVEIHGWVRWWHHGDHRHKDLTFFVKTAGKKYLLDGFRERDLRKE